MNHMLLINIAQSFIESGLAKATRVLIEGDINDEMNSFPLPKGQAIRLTLEYVDQNTVEETK